MRATKTKTNADDVTIKQTMKELSKEGKDLPDVSPAEATAWVDTKRFATELDPDLDSHERTIQLAQLERAREEAKNGVKGSRFHVWKNLMKRVASKMKKPVIALGLAGSILLGTAACSGGITKDDNNTPAPSSTSTSQPADPNKVYGDVIALKEVTDSKGTYQQTTVSPDDDSMKYDKAKVDQTAYDAGFTDTDIESAQKWIATFAAEEQADSIALDSNEGWNEWKSSKIDDYVISSQKDSILVPPSDGSSDRSGIIYNDPNNSMPELIRDGSPRTSGTAVTVDSISGGQADEGGYLWVSGSTASKLRVSEENALAWTKANNPGATDDAIKQSAPFLFNGSEDTYALNQNWSYALLKDGNSWKIGGYTNNFSSAFVAAN